MTRSPRTPGDIERRRGLADASSGYAMRVPVVLYACVHDGRDPLAVMAALRMHAEARDWLVRAALYDIIPITSSLAERKAWPNAQQLVERWEVHGLVARCEDEIAFSSSDKDRLREWLFARRAFAAYFPEQPGQQLLNVAQPPTPPERKIRPRMLPSNDADDSTTQQRLPIMTLMTGENAPLDLVTIRVATVRRALQQRTALPRFKETREITEALRGHLQVMLPEAQFRADQLERGSEAWLSWRALIIRVQDDLNRDSGSDRRAAAAHMNDLGATCRRLADCLGE